MYAIKKIISNIHKQTNWFKGNDEEISSSSYCFPLLKFKAYISCIEVIFIDIHIDFLFLKKLFIQRSLNVENLLFLDIIYTQIMA